MLCWRPVLLRRSLTLSVAAFDHWNSHWHVMSTASMLELPPALTSCQTPPDPTTARLCHLLKACCPLGSIHTTNGVTNNGGNDGGEGPKCLSFLVLHTKEHSTPQLRST